MVCLNDFNATSTSIVSFRKKVLMLVIICSILKWQSTSGKVLADDTITKTADDDEIQMFRAGRSNVPVYVVKNFLPLDVANRWRSVLSNEWEKFSESANGSTNKECGSVANTATKSEESSNSCKNTNGIVDNIDDNGWRYTTNNDGVYRGMITNQKIRGLQDIEARNATAHKLKGEGLFSYAKWEFHPQHELVKEMEDMFLHDERILSKVTRSFESDGVDGMKVDISRDSLSDLFVTLYSTSDFLSSHDDFFMGSYAFVVSLLETPDDGRMEGWKDDYGGILRFQCTPNQYRQKVAKDSTNSDSFCHHLKPSFNTAVLFQTRNVNGNGGKGPDHEVTTVSENAELEGFRRFGLTGWYKDKKDIMSKVEREELGKVRAN